MLHSRLFTEEAGYRKKMFEPTRHSASDPKRPELYLDGNPSFDRPLIVQFCANDPAVLLAAARIVEPYCDAVDLNLGCPQGIAKSGRYGAFLQENQPLIYELINTLHQNLSIPVTAKFRILDTREKTLDYARLLLDAGASFITVHGRQRHQKGHYTGLADWEMIRYLRDNLPPDTVLFANGNILNNSDIQRCLEITGADGVMSAEGNLHDPTIFAGRPAAEDDGYWVGRDGKGGWRVDSILRRYLDIIYKYVLQKDPPRRPPLFTLSDPLEESDTEEAKSVEEDEVKPEPRGKKRKRADGERLPKIHSPNLGAMQPHLFSVMRIVVGVHTDIRDQLARSRGGDMESFEKVLSMVEKITKRGMIEYERETRSPEGSPAQQQHEDEWCLMRNRRQRRRHDANGPGGFAQPFLRPLPKEALAKGLLQLSKKEQARIAKEEAKDAGTEAEETGQALAEKPVLAG